MHELAALLVFAFGIYLVGLFLAGVVRPHATDRFLMAFANSAGTHVLEQVVRIAVGMSLITHASSMPASAAFRGFGWILVVTSAGLLLIPWRKHRAFAQRAVPLALRARWVYLSGALMLGALILWSVFAGPVAPDGPIGVP